MKRLPFALLFVISIQGFSQSVSGFMGASSKGMGNATACLEGEWSLLNNIGGLASIQNPVIAASFDVHPQLEAANRTAFVFAMPVKIGVAGISAFRFGDN
ncbi:MAG: hypothetical protein L0Y35_03435, partial [Flammeovirgaceae bacterium]|nr:hypothetical protein [Flammeovirgaceae bacterium]